MPQLLVEPSVLIVIKRAYHRRWISRFIHDTDRHHTQERSIGPYLLQQRAHAVDVRKEVCSDPNK